MTMTAGVRMRCAFLVGLNAAMYKVARLGSAHVSASLGCKSGI